MSESEASPRWLPRFCSLPTLFAVMLVAEIVVLLVMLAPGGDTLHWWSRLGIASVFAQWLALMNAVMLCSLGPPLQRLSMRGGLFVAWLSTLLMTALATAVVQSLDHAAGFGLVPAGADQMLFVPGVTLITALISAALLRYFYVLESWRQRVSDAAQSRVDAMQARIRPHFLFNSMNTIASLIRSRPADAERAVEDLSDLFRAALGADAHPATLGEELDLIGHYLPSSRAQMAALFVFRESEVVTASCSRYATRCRTMPRRRGTAWRWRTCARALRIISASAANCVSSAMTANSR